MRSERGITIIETTVILSVLFILAGVMSPIVGESVSTARAVKAKNDAAMIAMGLINLQKDLGGDAISFGGAAELLRAAGGGPGAGKLPDVLASEGEEPRTEEGDEARALESSILGALRPGQARRAANGAGGGRGRSRRAWLENKDSLDSHLRSNRRGYRFRQPGEYGGWNGPYVSAELKGDPWGHQYVINTRWLDGSATASDENGNTRRAVFVVSAGGNGVIDTPFDQPVTDAQAYGDDIVIRLQ